MSQTWPPRQTMQQVSERDSAELQMSSTLLMRAYPRGQRGHPETRGGHVNTHVKEQILEEETQRWDLWADHTRVIPVCGESHCITTEQPLAQSQL